jgi:hypothetical protein
LAIVQSELRLDGWQFSVPACDRFIRPKANTDLALTVVKQSIEQRAGESLALPLTLFWFDPPWHLANVERSRDVSRAMAEAGIVVSALHRDLSQRDDCDASVFAPRMAPHRCDRAGWIHRDFENVSIIDLRMTPTRNSEGRYAYESSQLQRWKNVEDEQNDEPNRGVNALLFPPDWRTLSDMTMKISQLRRLSDAAVFVSCDAANLTSMLPAIVSAKAEGVIVRTVGDPASSIIAARKLLDGCEADTTMQLWIALDQSLSPADQVKCFALGANALSVDSMCNDFLLNEDQSRSLANRAAYGLGFRPTGDHYEVIRQSARDLVVSLAEQIRGYANSCGVERLGDLTPEHLKPTGA